MAKVFFLAMGLCVLAGAESGGPLGDLDKRLDHLSRQKTELTRARAAWTEFDKRLAYPCDLKATKSLPPLILQGQSQATAACHDEACRTVQSAASGTCHAGVDGVVYCKAGSALGDDALRDRFRLGKGIGRRARVSGIEDEFTQGFGSLLSVEAAFHEGRAKSFAEIVAQISENTYLAEAWDRYAKRGKHSEIETQVITVVESVRESPTKTLPELNPNSVHTVLHGWLRAYAELALTETYRAKQLTPPNLLSVVNGLIDGTDRVLPVQIAVVEWRNRFLAKNIAELYCKALAEGKTLHIIADAQQIPGLYDLLRSIHGPAIERDAPRPGGDALGGFAELFGAPAAPKKGAVVVQRNSIGLVENGYDFLLQPHGHLSIVSEKSGAPLEVSDATFPAQEAKFLAHLASQLPHNAVLRRALTELRNDMRSYPRPSRTGGASQQSRARILDWLDYQLSRPPLD